MIRENGNIDTMQISDAKKQRIEEAYQKILCLNPKGIKLQLNQEWLPAWSSHGLEQLIGKVLSTPEGCINDLFIALWKALSDTRAPLTQTMSYFLKDIATYSGHALRWQNNRKNVAWHRKDDYEWMIPLVTEACTEAQAYFAMYVLSVDAPTDCKEAILRILEKTEFTELTKSMLFN